ncbi:hypothetical protein NE236_31535 [Actinoallomurus purpureus]|uniref:DUF6758 family protein n=1 Tax=Actinoallomurus purpureus TaxID=478114 RepID=UPI0020930C73|nr:DUF6758 family protein [Actinoallomurus purpureus]MCO6009513.1 hypothetical protein [Actinoallomurus purpureus]
MRAAPICPRCRGPVTPPNLWSSAWTCVAHGEVSPLRPPRRPCRDGLGAVRAETRVPIWVPWPPPKGWLVTGFADAGDERTGSRAVAVALSGPSPVGGPADLILVAEEPGIGLGASYAGLSGPDPGHDFGTSTPDAKVDIDGHPLPLWAVSTAETAAFAGEALGHWLWAILWPPSAGPLMLEDLRLRDLREADLDVPFGAACPRLGA